MVDTPDGQLLQTGMVGQDGVIGAAQASDDKISINRIIVQIPGTASMIDRDPLRKAMQEGSAVQRILDPMIAGPEGGPSSDMQRYEG
jgi:hypothetical protein